MFGFFIDVVQIVIPSVGIFIFLAKLCDFLVHLSKIVKFFLEVYPNFFFLPNHVQNMADSIIFLLFQLNDFVGQVDFLFGPFQLNFVIAQKRVPSSVDF